jgi:8-oxo-dGTP diphosphatase
MEYLYCPVCGNPVETVEEEGYKRWRCPACGKKIYRNPTVGVAAILFENGEILLVKRANGVSYEGCWCIPCGHVEWGEDIREAGRREFLEETGIEAEIGPVFEVHSNFHDPKHFTVGIWFWASRTGGEPLPGSDAEEVRFFPIDEIPDKMAFPTDLYVIGKIKRRMESGSLPGDRRAPTLTIENRKGDLV